MLFIPTVEKRGNTAAVLLDEPHTFAEGLDYDTAREIASALSDRFEIYAIKDKPGFVVMAYDQDTLAQTVTAETWSDALRIVARLSTDLVPMDSTMEGMDSSSNARAHMGIDGKTITPRMDYSLVDSLRYLHLGTPLDVALDALDECADTADLGTVRAAIETTQALIRDEYTRHRYADEDPAFYSNGMPVSTAVPHIANDGKQTFVSPAQHVNHPGDGFRLLTRSVAVDRRFDGLEDGYVA